MDKYENLQHRGKFKHILELAEKNPSPGESKYWKTTALWQMGKHQEALTYIKTFENNLENLGDKWHGRMLVRIGAIYIFLRT